MAVTRKAVYQCKRCGNQRSRASLKESSYSKNVPRPCWECRALHNSKFKESGNENRDKKSSKRKPPQKKRIGKQGSDSVLTVLVQGQKPVHQQRTSQLQKKIDETLRGEPKVLKMMFQTSLRNKWSKIVSDNMSVLAFSRALKGQEQQGPTKD